MKKNTRYLVYCQSSICQEAQCNPTVVIGDDALYRWQVLHDDRKGKAIIVKLRKERKSATASR